MTPFLSAWPLKYWPPSARNSPSGVYPSGLMPSTAAFIAVTFVPICATIAPPHLTDELQLEPETSLFQNLMTPNRTPVTLSSSFLMTRLAMSILGLGQVRPTQPA